MHSRIIPSPLQVSRWFNTPAPITLDALRGKVVAIHSFQMLCPGCVSHGLPQAKRLREAFPADQLAVIGLHTVFEHHAVMGADALAAFIHEYRLAFPIGIDEANPDGPIPRTMTAWSLRGTPSLILLDRDGRLCLSHFGQIDDLVLGSIIGQLLERPAQLHAGTTPAAPAPGCDEGTCPAPRR
ncbi:MAG: redoxin domain-containing protein [Dokdonella sp.]|uniref:redoxin domain-containing protein n=1 Tax=Dokdonella sp. TaxID=2291710 RepID=UPI0025BC653B|nr:redoxin domain-containing protein [Dokdonella sp.]MBZ0223654.1 redoxin domain-containing protein [Dokdonella sp.]